MIEDAEMSKSRIRKDESAVTLVEILIAVAILVVMTGAAFGLLATGQSSWLTADASIALQENLRQTTAKISQELHGTGFDKNSVAQFTIMDGAGPNGTDVLRFSIPVVCHSGDNVMDANGDIAHWGGALTWGCTSSSCMDANDDCASVEYARIEYRVDNNNRLIRSVLDPASSIVRQDTFAHNIVDFQVSLSANQRVMTLNVTAQRNSVANLVLSASTGVDIYLRNRG